MSTVHKHHTLWFLWPIAALWRLLATIVGLTGRFVAMVIGSALFLTGVIVSLTEIGRAQGIPLAAVGLLLFFKGLF